MVGRSHAAIETDGVRSKAGCETRPEQRAIRALRQLCVKAAFTRVQIDRHESVATLETRRERGDGGRRLRRRARRRLTVRCRREKGGRGNRPECPHVAHWVVVPCKRPSRIRRAFGGAAQSSTIRGATDKYFNDACSVSACVPRSTTMGNGDPVDPRT